MARIIERGGMSSRPPKENRPIPSITQTMLLGIDVLPSGCAFSIGGISKSKALTITKLWESSAVSLKNLRSEIVSFLKNDYCEEIQRWFVNINEDTEEFKLATKQGFTLEDMKLYGQHTIRIYTLYTNPLLDNLVNDLKQDIKNIRETVDKQFVRNSTININYKYVIDKQKITALENENGLICLLSCINDNDFELRNNSDLTTIQTHLKEVDLDAPIVFPTKNPLVNSLVYSIGEKYYRMKCGKDFSTYDIANVNRAIQMFVDSGVRLR
ncbi:MAG: hypothetical protein AAFV71_19545 [Cyanobacteria bacterium J06633_8]